jgi:hypothetical protein
VGTTPSAHDWTAGDDATSTALETLTDAANYALGRVTSGGSRKPLFVGTLSVAQTLTSSVEAGLLLDSEVIDNDNGHSTVTNTTRYTGQTPGWYLAFCGVQFASNVNGLRQAGIGQSGTPVGGDSMMTVPATGAVMGVQVTAFVFLNGTTDYVEARALQTSGGNLNVIFARLRVFLLSA